MVELDGVLAPLCQWYNYRGEREDADDRSRTPDFNTATCFIHDVAQRRGPINLDRFLGRVAPDDDRIEIELIGTKRRMTIEIVGKSLREVFLDCSRQVELLAQHRSAGKHHADLRARRVCCRTD